MPKQKLIDDTYYWVLQRPTHHANGRSEYPHWEPMLHSGGRFYHRGLPDDHPGISPRDLRAVGSAIVRPDADAKVKQMQLYAPTTLIAGRLALQSVAPDQPHTYTLSARRSVVGAERIPVRVTVTWGGDASSVRALSRRKAREAVRAAMLSKAQQREARVSKLRKRIEEIKTARLARRLNRGLAAGEVLRAAKHAARVTCDRLAVDSGAAKMVRKWLSHALGGRWGLDKEASNDTQLVWRSPHAPGWLAVKHRRPHYKGPAVRGMDGKPLPYGYSLFYGDRYERFIPVEAAMQ